MASGLENIPHSERPPAGSRSILRYMETSRTYSTAGKERASGYTHPLDRRLENCPSERDDALADLNAHLERTSRPAPANRLRDDYGRSAA